MSRYTIVDKDHILKPTNIIADNGVIVEDSLGDIFIPCGTKIVDTNTGVMIEHESVDGFSGRLKIDGKKTNINGTVVIEYASLSVCIQPDDML